VKEQFNAWYKSFRSSGGGNCTEVSLSDDGYLVGMRDSKDPDGPILVFPKEAFRQFVAGVRAGEFDLA